MVKEVVSILLYASFVSWNLSFYTVYQAASSALCRFLVTRLDICPIHRSPAYKDEEGFPSICSLVQTSLLILICYVIGLLMLTLTSWPKTMIFHWSVIKQNCMKLSVQNRTYAFLICQQYSTAIWWNDKIFIIQSYEIKCTNVCANDNHTLYALLDLHVTWNTTSIIMRNNILKIQWVSYSTLLKSTCVC